MQPELAPGHDIQVVGAEEAGIKGEVSIAAGPPRMLFVMFPLPVLQRRSAPRAFLGGFTAPMGIVGVAAAPRLNRPFGFAEMRGFIALAAMIVRKPLMLIDQIEQGLSKALARPCAQPIKRGISTVDR